MPTFGTVLTAMVTPFTADNQVDYDGAATLARWLVENGNDGLVIAGTTGESPTLTHDEQNGLIRVVCESVTVPVVAGAGSNDTRAAIDLSKRAAEAGAAGLLHVAGYYNRPSQAGLDAHFRAVADATELPILLYDIPIRTGRKISTATMSRLVREVPTIIGVKDANGNPAESAHLIACTPGVELYSGDDAMTLPLLAVGAVGTIGVATHWVGPEISEMIAAFTSGDTGKAIALNAELIPHYHFETSDEAPNPVPTKSILRLLGLPGGQCRLPMGPEPEGLADEAVALLRSVGRL